jgi:hypothetical protein
MKIKYGSILIIALASIIAAAQAESYALGFGVYSSIGTGPTPLSIKGSRNHMDNSLGAGIVLDTATASNELVNYRTHIGYTSVVNNGSRFLGRYGMNRVTWSNIFGFGLVRTRHVRFWVGPQVAFDCVFKNLNRQYRLKAAVPSWGIYYYRAEHYRFVIPLISVGFALGLNIHMGDHFTVGLELGMLTGMGTGRHHYIERDLFIVKPGMPGQMIVPVYKPHSQDYAYFKFEMMAAVCVMFRVGDVYHSAPKPNTDIPSGTAKESQRPTVGEAFPPEEGDAR